MARNNFKINEKPLVFLVFCANVKGLRIKPSNGGRIGL